MSTNHNDASENTMQFPCEFSIKVIGLANDAFEMEAISIIHKHIDNLKEDALAMRYSRDRKYLAITITFTAESREQLDNLYREISASPRVLMAL